MSETPSEQLLRDIFEDPWRRVVDKPLKPGGQFLAVPHTPLTDRLPLHVLVTSMAIRAGLWHELKTFDSMDVAIERAIQLRRYDAGIETMFQGCTLFARIVPERVSA